MTANNYVIPKFEPRTSKKNCVWLIIGPRNTGKSVLLKDLLYKTKDNYDYGIAMTKTKSTVDMFNEFLPAHFIYSNGYDFNSSAKFIENADRIVRAGKVRYGAFIMDDLMYNNKVMKTETQKDFHLNGRHYNTSLFNTTQYCMIIPNDIRTNVDYIFALRDNIVGNRKRLYEYFFGIFKTFNEFDKVFSSCTQNFSALVLDKTKSSTSVEQCMRWYKADIDTPIFKLGKQIFFEISEIVKLKTKKQKNSKHI